MNLFERLGQQSPALTDSILARAAGGAILSPAEHRALIGAGVGLANSAAVIGEHEAARNRNRAVVAAGTLAAFGGAALSHLIASGTVVSGAAGSTIGAGEGAVAAEAAAATMPAAVSPSMFSAEALKGYAAKIGSSVASSLVLKQLAPKISAPAGASSLSPTRSSSMFNSDGSIDFSALSDLGLQVVANRLQSQPQQVAAAMPAAFPGLPALGAGVARLIPGLGAAAGAAVGVIRAVGGRILGFMLPSGMKVTRKAAVNLAKQIGIVGAASALGAGVEDVAEAILQEDKAPRRGRGISPAQMRVTLRTIGKVERAHKKIAKVARAHTR